MSSLFGFVTYTSGWLWSFFQCTKHSFVCTPLQILWRRPHYLFFKWSAAGFNGPLPYFPLTTTNVYLSGIKWDGLSLGAVYTWLFLRNAWGALKNYVYGSLRGTLEVGRHVLNKYLWNIWLLELDFVTLSHKRKVLFLRYSMLWQERTILAKNWYKRKANTEIHGLHCFYTQDQIKMSVHFFIWSMQRSMK